ncbi:MAG: hypothetical protein IV107_03870 [Paucibacter sp.]|nr:hypothetical protein [Roseateles sp.]
MSQEDAADKADYLLKELIQNQPQLFLPPVPTSNNGNHLGDAIAALRLKLIEMYKTQP